jgi:hypothetical protein
VPLVGDFAGPKAIRGVAQYVQEHGHRRRLLYVKRRAVLIPGHCQLETFLRQCRLSADRSYEHVYSIRSE